MCCRSTGGFVTTKNDHFFTISEKIQVPFTQNRSDTFSRITFPIHSPSSLALGFRVISRPGCGSGRFSCRALFEGSVSSSDSRTLYELLGISETGTLSEIKQAYKQLARKYHPDVSPPDRVEEYTQRFIQVHEAYETLSDPNKRALYDIDLAMGIRFAFTARKRYPNYDEILMDKSRWRSNVRSQLDELERRSKYRDIGSNTWGAKMRRHWSEQSAKNSADE